MDKKFVVDFPQESSLFYYGILIFKQNSSNIEKFIETISETNQLFSYCSYYETEEGNYLCIKIHFLTLRILRYQYENHIEKTQQFAQQRLILFAEKLSCADFIFIDVKDVEEDKSMNIMFDNKDN